MEAASSSTSEVSLSSWDYVNLLLLRPSFAIAFVLFLICLGWLLAWKLVLVHVPLVQEICGLRKKPVKPKPPTRRLSKIYSSIYTRDYASGCHITSWVSLIFHASWFLLALHCCFYIKIAWTGEEQTLRTCVSRKKASGRTEWTAQQFNCFDAMDNLIFRQGR